MRKYNEENTKMVKAFCNCCGKEFEVENGIIMEGCLHSDWMFGYFSSKDRQKHEFDLCEACYEKISNEFVIPPQVTNVTELL